MKLPKAEFEAIEAKMKAFTRASTSRASEGTTLAKSAPHTRGLIRCYQAIKLAHDWDGSREELDIRLKEAEDYIREEMAAGDAHVANFPPGTGRAFGATTGMPVIVNGDESSCHECGGIVRIRGRDGVLDAVFLKLDAGRDVLLFVVHKMCWEKRNKGETALDLVDREEWSLLLAARDVLSS